jgi:hypothetical protein
LRFYGFDEVKSIGGKIPTDRGNPKYSETNVFHSHSVHLWESGRRFIYQGLKDE